MTFPGVRSVEHSLVIHRPWIRPASLEPSFPPPVFIGFHGKIPFPGVEHLKLPVVVDVVLGIRQEAETSRTPFLLFRIRFFTSEGLARGSELRPRGFPDLILLQYRRAIQNPRLSRAEITFPESRLENDSCTRRPTRFWVRSLQDQGRERGRRFHPGSGDFDELQGAFLVLGALERILPFPAGAIGSK
jgi:hypothetical protein